ncbi:hypothetical protein CDO52_01840 [Nocardiopsis gilva YIM 90087]|uniref:Uncharacterized protein n=1 Tax=Nocardiopsis gilva YIM 90087 TaxID=1235441 RepID=A0A223S0R8_9ACTN|nr:hypothetical protein CDO52_01840 [Nocardiopsis gilva YIM 90087]
MLTGIVDERLRIGLEMLEPLLDPLGVISEIRQRASHRAQVIADLLTTIGHRVGRDQQLAGFRRAVEALEQLPGAADGLPDVRGVLPVVLQALGGGPQLLSGHTGHRDRSGHDQLFALQADAGHGRCGRGGVGDHRGWPSLSRGAGDGSRGEGFRG